MRHSRNEVARWRMKRQMKRRRIRWLEDESRRYGRIRACRYLGAKLHRRSSLLFTKIKAKP